MKKGVFKLVVSMFIIGIIAVCVSCKCENIGNTVKGNGVLQTSEKTVSEFDKIVADGDVEVRYYASEEYRVVFTIDENLQDYAEIFTKNNVLNIGLKSNVSYSRITKYSVDVYCPVLTDVSADGFVDFESMDVISTPTFKTGLFGSGKMKSAIECEKFFTNIDGFGEMTITGNSNDARIDISGSGIFDGKEFKTKNATIDIDGFGEVYIWVTEKLKVNISGSGTLYYIGEPQIESNIDGFGRIIKM